MVEAVKKASGKDVPYKITERRPGDVGANYADPTKAEREMHWKAQLGLEDMCRDGWNWQQKNPDGFRTPAQ